MSKGVVVMLMTIVAVAGVCWYCGDRVWDAMLAMHGRR